MPSPIANFGYTVNGLEVIFADYSLNTETNSTYLWEFGDGSTSIEKTPTHLFSDAGYYPVSLTITNPDTSTNTLVVTINLSGSISPSLFFNIPSLVDLYSPTAIIGTIRNHNQKEFLISKWQEYLQPLVWTPHAVSISDTHNATAWPSLVNSLMARLVVIDLIQMEAAAFLLNSAVTGQTMGSSQSSGESTVSSPGGIKSIETGPTKIERYENKDASSSSEAMTNLANVYKSLITPGGVLDQLKMFACQEAERLQIFLPMCGPLPSPNKGFSIIKKNCTGYNANPFGITKRMT